MTRPLTKAGAFLKTPFYGALKVPTSFLLTGFSLGRREKA